MHPDKFEAKMKDMFSSMDEQDSAEALARKEKIWAAVNQEEKSRPNHKLWWLLLLVPLLFFAGWFSKSSPTTQPPPNKTDIPIANNQEKAAAESELKALSALKAQLSDTQKRLDALLKAHTDLSLELDTYKNRTSVSRSEKVEYVRQTDTIYLTRKEVDQRVVEKIVRDTVFIEVPTELLEPISTVESTLDSQLPKNQDLKKVKKERRSSIQFNFNKADHLDK